MPSCKNAVHTAIINALIPKNKSLLLRKQIPETAKAAARAEDTLSNRGGLKARVTNGEQLLQPHIGNYRGYFLAAQPVGQVKIDG